MKEAALTRGKLCLYLAGQVGLMMMVRFLLQWIIRFATSEAPDVSTGESLALFSASTMGAILLGFRIFDGVTDPVAGAISDIWVRKGRQRRHLLWYSFFLPAFGLVLCFAPTHEMASTLRWALVTSGLIVFFVGYTLYCIPYWSLILDYAQGNQDTQRTLSNLLGLGVLIATAIGFGLTPILIDLFGYLLSVLLVSVVGTVFMVLPIFAQPENSRIDSAQSESVQIDLFGSVLTSLRDRRFAALLTLLSGAQMSLTVMTSAAPFIAIHLLGGTDADVAKLLGPFLGVGLLSLSFTTWLSRRWGWEKSLLVGCVALGVVYASTSGLDEPLFGTRLQSAMCLFMCGGPMVAIILGLEGEAITHCAIAKSDAHVSMYWGVYNFVIKAMNGVAIWVCGVLASRITLAGDNWLVGTAAVKAMSLAAGGFLVVGVIAYLLVRPKQQTGET